MSEEIDRSAALIERLLSEPELRRRFLADPAGILKQHGLPDLAAELGGGKRALMTLELRESRSSLAGVMVAAAAEAVDLAHVVERATPGVLHDAGHALSSIGSGSGTHAHHASHLSAPAAGAPVAGAATPNALGPMAQPAQHPAPAAAPAAVPPAGPAAPAPAAPAPAPSAAAPPAAAPAPSANHEPATSGAVTGRGRLGSHPHAEGASPPDQAGGRPATPGGHDAHRQPAAGMLDTPPTQPADPLVYPGDSASPQQLAAWMGAHAVKAGLPAELPVMAALTESGLRNLNYGDRDSVGFFQMRQGIWNQGPYTGYPTNPELQIQWFIDHATAVKAQYPVLAQNPATWGELVANVEQPAAEYRYRYQLELATAQALLHGAQLAVPPPAPPVPLGQAALKVALQYLQTPSSVGSSRTGIDSSGLVQLAFAHQGIQLPRVAAAQFDVGAPVGREDLRLGDAVFFKDDSGFVHQVGLYVGSGRFLTAPDPSGQPRIASLSDPRFAQHYAGARRYTLGALGDPRSYARSLPTISG